MQQFFPNPALQMGMAAQGQFMGAAALPAGDMTNQDFSQYLDVSARGGLNVMFFYAKEQIDNPTDPTIHGTWVTRLCVAKHPKGDRLTTAVRLISEAEAQAAFPVEFGMFKNGQDIMPTLGTPLHELPGITMSQIAMMLVHGLRSIEDVAGMAREHMNGIGMDAIACHELATKWMQRKTEGAGMIDAARSDAVAAAENEAMRRELERLRADNARLQGQVDLVTRLVPQGAATQEQPQAMLVDTASAPVAENPDIDDQFATAGGMVTGKDDLVSIPDEDPDPLGLGVKSKRR